MAKEADLKKVDLKVSIDCCDGCKRKVKKLLQNIEGVLKIDLDPMKTTVTVLGNVDPQFLIKKLHKAGKQAQILKVSAGGDKKKDKETDMSPTNSKEDTVKKVAENEDQKGKDNQEMFVNPAKSVEVKYAMYPSLVVDPTDRPGYHVVMPTYYPVCSYLAPLPQFQAAPPETDFGREFGRPSVLEAPFGRVENYFNEENTVGCQVM